MRNLIYGMVAMLVAFAIVDHMRTYPFEQPTPVKYEASEKAFDTSVDPWMVKPPIVDMVRLIGTQATPASSWDDGSAAIEAIEARVAKLESSMFAAEKELGEHDKDIIDLGNGQADLKKRVEELTALIEKRCPDGTVKTQSVAVNPVGSTSFNLAKGEIVYSVDGVPVSPQFSSGGSNGSTVASTTTTSTANYGSYPVAAPQSGGSNGSLQYTQSAQQYQTSSYNVSTTPTATNTQVQIAPRRPLQNLRAKAPVRSVFTPRGNARCNDPNNPNCNGTNRPN